jgi:hypothetical protein
VTTMQPEAPTTVATIDLTKLPPKAPTKAPATVAATDLTKLQPTVRTTAGPRPPADLYAAVITNLDGVPMRVDAPFVNVQDADAHVHDEYAGRGFVVPLYLLLRFRSWRRTVPYSPSAGT